MLVGTPTPEPKAKSAQANAIVPIGRNPADMVLAPMIRRRWSSNSITKRYKSGNPALLSVHFADAVSPEKSYLRRRKWPETHKIVG
jgi:hypothetical protein